jgi:virginiamycin B lyase
MRAAVYSTIAMITIVSASAQQRWLGPAETLAATGRIAEFPLPHAGSAPTTIAIAPDGLVWFTEAGGNRIGRMRPDGTDLVEFDVPTANSAPRIIALGADGNMWFSEHASGKMARITPAGAITEFDIPTRDSQPRAIALGADGNIWFGMFAAGKIGRIGPRGDVVEFPLPRENSGPGDITAGADGNLWFLELNGNVDGRVVTGNRVARITPDGVITEFDLPSATGSPTNIAVGPDRNIWYTKGRMLGRVTPEGEITEFPLPATARGVGLTAGSDRQPPARLVDRLWYADGAGDKLSYLEFE